MRCSLTSAYGTAGSYYRRSDAAAGRRHTGTVQYSFSYGSVAQPLLAVLGCGPRFSRVVVDGAAVDVRMGWSFRARVPRRAVAGAAPWPTDRRRPWSRGAHGWRGRWLVNGSAAGLVVLTIDPPAHARVLGIPVTVRELVVSVTEPDALVSELQPPAR